MFLSWLKFNWIELNSIFFVCFHLKFLLSARYLSCYVSVCVFFPAALHICTSTYATIVQLDRQPGIFDLNKQKHLIFQLVQNNSIVCTIQSNEWINVHGECVCWFYINALFFSMEYFDRKGNTLHAAFVFFMHERERVVLCQCCLFT